MGLWLGHRSLHPHGARHKPLGNGVQRCRQIGRGIGGTHRRKEKGVGRIGSAIGPDPAARIGQRNGIDRIDLRDSLDRMHRPAGDARPSFVLNRLGLQAVAIDLARKILKNLLRAAVGVGTGKGGKHKRIAARRQQHHLAQARRLGRKTRPTGRQRQGKRPRGIGIARGKSRAGGHGARRRQNPRLRRGRRCQPSGLPLLPGGWWRRWHHGHGAWIGKGRCGRRNRRRRGNRRQRRHAIDGNPGKQLLEQRAMLGQRHLRDRRDHLPQEYLALGIGLRKGQLQDSLGATFDMHEQRLLPGQRARFMRDNIGISQQRLVGAPPARPKLIPPVGACEIIFLIAARIGDCPARRHLKHCVAQIEFLHLLRG